MIFSVYQNFYENTRRKSACGPHLAAVTCISYNNELRGVSVMKTAIYCRLSVEDAGLEPGNASESILNQQLLLLDYARKHGLEVFAIYVDEDYSGMDDRRPAFCRMIEDASIGRFQIILCKTQSRFTRNMATAEKYLHGLFPLWGVRFIGVVDGVDTSLSANKKARQINSLINEWYCEDLSENIRSILRKKMESGQFIGSFACYGYLKDPSDRHKLIPDPAAASVVRQIYRLYLDGFGIGTICHLLEATRTPSPSAYKKQQGLAYRPVSEGESPFHWHPSTVKRILKNPVYTGALVQGKQRKLNYKSQYVLSVPQEQWIVVPDCHPAVIDEEMFLQVQERFAKRRKR